MNLLEMYQVYQNSDGFKKELYGSLYRVLGGKKKVEFVSKETEWYLRFLYYLYRARKSFASKEKSYNSELRKLEAKNRAHSSPLLIADIRRIEAEFATFKLNYFIREVIEKSTNELKMYGIQTRLTTNFERPGFLILTLLKKDGYSFNYTDFSFADSNYIAHIINFFTECYICLRDSKTTMFKVKKTDVDMITSYIGQINKIFENRNLRIR